MKTLVTIKQKGRPDRHLIVTFKYSSDEEKFAESWSRAVESVKERYGEPENFFFLLPFSGELSYGSKNV